MAELSLQSQDKHHNDYRIILYYCYIDIDQVNLHLDFHRELCEELGLMGRIRVSEEGINGVLSGRIENCQQYEEKLRAELTRMVPPTNDNNEVAWELDVKYCLLRNDLSVSAQLFDSLMVKATSCIVSLFEPGLASNNNHGETSSSTKKRSQQSNRRKRRQQQRRELQQEKLHLDNNLQELANQTLSFPGGRHLSPAEWNQKLSQTKDAVLLDCRNVYESNIGYFQAPQAKEAPTLLTNTRKYSDLPKVLAQSKDQWVHKKEIFMYCTGGVRCEVASKFVQALVASEHGEDGAQNKDVQVYQLHGGIQRYLEYFQDSNNNNKDGGTPKDDECLFRGLNFVFDPRRTDPMVKKSDSCVGKCCLCQSPHDDYDNGHSPMENREARCCKCRILLLVCSSCRVKVQSWGEQQEKEGMGLPKLYCGIDHCSDYQATGENPVRVAEVRSNGVGSVVEAN